MSEVSRRQQVAGLLAERETVARAAAGAQALLPDVAPAVGLVRCLLFLAGAATPPVATVPALVQALAASGWQVFPVAFGPPQPGDLWVQADAQRQPVTLGFVGPLSLDHAYFSAVRADGERVRMQPAEVEFFLRLPCPTCDQARPGLRPAARR